MGFPEMRKKIDKRGRKLIDFDAERHAVQQMQNNPNRNEAKFVRAKESMENAKRTYDPKLRASRRVAGPARQPDSVPCDKHADSLCRGGGVPLRDSQGLLRAGRCGGQTCRKLRGALCQGKRSQNHFQLRTTAATATSATTSYQ